MSVKEFISGDVRVLGSAKRRMTTATTTAFDFGTPNDLYLPDVLRKGERVLVVFEAYSSAQTIATLDAALDALDTALDTTATNLTTLNGDLLTLDGLIATADAVVTPDVPDFTDILAAMTALHTSVGSLEDEVDAEILAVTALIAGGAASNTEGSTDTVSFVIQDADDSSGSIGTPDTAITYGDLTGGTGNQTAVAGVQLQSGRPWLRCAVTSDGTTDTFDVSCTVLALPPGL